VVGKDVVWPSGCQVGTVDQHNDAGYDNLHTVAKRKTDDGIEHV